MTNLFGRTLWRILARSEVARQQHFATIVADAARRDVSEVDPAGVAAPLRSGEPTAQELATWCALVRAAARRGTGMEPYDEQFLGALHLLDGDIVEMATGEGKTLSGALAAIGYVHRGRRVHVITINDYLARRDATWMGPVFDELGVTVGWIEEQSTPEKRRRAYSCQVTYVSISEVGFDMLRDRQALDPGDRVLPELDVALIDEVDAVLVDEARLPLVLAGADDDALGDDRVARIVEQLTEGEHYEVDTDRNQTHLTDAGADVVAERLGGIDLYSTEHVGGVLATVNLALHARALLHRDVHYLVTEHGIEPVSASRGRVAERQRWPDGLHAALEAKEGLAHSASSNIVDSVTVKGVVERYRSRCGMTGTALSAADTLRELYSLEVTVIPPHRPLRRVDEPDRLYATGRHRDDAVLAEIAAHHATGRPILAVTGDVAECEDLGRRLADAGLRCSVLNARNPHREAEIIAEAGREGAITVSTQLAGRGVDIRLGGSDESGRDRVAELGGLYVLGTRHQPSRRLDDQVRGRAGRQGDPGGSVFFVSLDDELLQRHAVIPSATTVEPDGRVLPANHRGPFARLRHRPGRTASRPSAGSDRGAPARQPGPEHRFIERALLTREGVDHEVRSLTEKYHRPIDHQRDIVGRHRDRLLTTDAADRLLRERRPAAHAQVSADRGQAETERLCRHIVLSTLDEHWRGRLADVAELREGIHLRALGRYTPLTEYLRDTLAAFDGFLDRVHHDAAATFEKYAAEGAPADRPPVVRPSATWTYLMQDNPFGSELDRVLRFLGM
ncbi:protein translocase subunit secA [Stackebrandtia endophytica]|uniref:Protein translocase subunit SecA n=1 Tax=Stackebrandtia endophytica TaxID=1496996 RepID=A0A543AZL3_9ACTN|nr:accessory Sec system translocase SecA2 [Stackebrandtia endophytica]TQL78009.1 protein translocase subunit secA [Stackebrandtia endophytica]